MAKKRTPRRVSTRTSRAAPVSRPSDPTGPARTPMIVTFKPKEQRQDKTDKVQIVMDAISSRVQIYWTSVTSPLRPAACETGLPTEEMGFDVNMYDAPIVTLSLTYQEIAALRANPNVAMVEDDGLCYALPD